MITRACTLAVDPRVPIAEGLRVGMHAKCAGVYVDGDTGDLALCSCSCHAQDPRTPAQRAIGRQLEIYSARTPQPSANTRKKAANRPTGDRIKPPPTKAGVCEHCGAATRGGRFLPGHDGALKSELFKAASRGVVRAYAEIVQRGWEHLQGTAEISLAVIDNGNTLANTDPELTSRHNLERRYRAALPQETSSE